MPAFTGEHDVGRRRSDYAEAGGNILQREFARYIIGAPELPGVGMAVATATRTLKIEGEYSDRGHHYPMGKARQPASKSPPPPSSLKLK